MKQQTKADREILKVVGHPEGPRFGFGKNAVECHDYDEHRSEFVRVRGQWICPTCSEDER